MPRRSIGFEVGSSDHLLRAMESKLEDVLTALGDAQSRWDASAEALRQQLQGLEQRMEAHDEAVQGIASRTDANTQQCLAELRKLQAAVVHFRPALAGSPISEVLGAAAASSEAPAVNLARPVAQDAPTPRRKKKKVVRSAPQKDPVPRAVEETPLDEGNGLDLGVPLPLVLAVDDAAPLDSAADAAHDLPPNDIGPLAKKSKAASAATGNAYQDAEPPNGAGHVEPPAVAPQNVFDQEEPFNHVFGDPGPMKDAMMDDASDQQPMPLPPEDDLEELPASYDEAAEAQIPDGPPIPILDDAQAMPLANGAVPDMQYVDNGVEEMELDSSAGPKTSSTRKPAKKRKRSSRDFDSDEDDESDESMDVVEEVEVTSTRTATPSRSPRTLQRASQIVATIPSEEAAALVSEADDMKTRFFYEADPARPEDVKALYQRAAEEGNDPTAMLRLAQIWLQGAENLHPCGKRFDPSIPRALYWKKKLAAHNDADLHEAEIKVLEADIIMKKDRPKKKELDEALKKYMHGAKCGAEDGQFKLGQWYFEMYRRTPNGKNGKKNLLAAVKQLAKAVSGQSGPAAALLGSIYENSGKSEMYEEVIVAFEGKTLNEREKQMKAKALFFDSAGWGSGAGQNDCAACFEVAYADCDYNFDMAAESYRRAFEMGYAGAATNLALLYETGGKDGDRCDPQLACKWYETGAKVRCPNATYHLGVVYNYGNFKPRNVVEAVKLYEKSIKLAGNSGNSQDVEESARKDLERLLVTCILNEESNMDTCKEKLRKKKWGAVMKETRRCTQWIVAAKIKPSEYGSLPSAVSAPDEMEEALGEENATLIAGVLEDLCEREKNPDSEDDRAEAQRRLRDFVLDEKMRRNLGIDEPVVEPVSLYNYD